MQKTEKSNLDSVSDQSHRGLVVEGVICSSIDLVLLKSLGSFVTPVDLADISSSGTQSGHLSLILLLMGFNSSMYISPYPEKLGPDTFPRGGCLKGSRSPPGGLGPRSTFTGTFTKGRFLSLHQIPALGEQTQPPNTTRFPQAVLTRMPKWH